MEKGIGREFTATELETMINNYVDFWRDPLGRGDIEAEAAADLTRNALWIAKQLVRLLKQKSDSPN